MDASLGALLNLYTFSTGRRLFAFRQVLKLGTELAFQQLVTHVQAAIAHDTTTRALETKYAAAPLVAKSQAKVQAIDLNVDKALVAIRDSAQAQANGAGEDEEIRGMVAKLNAAVFPKGVLPIIQSTYVEELETVDGILSTLKSPEMAPIVAELGLGRLVKRLGKLAKEYRAAQVAPAPETVPFGDVRAARARGQENLLQAVAMILGKYPSSSADDIQARKALLAPILKQNEAIRLYLRSRRPVEDVNPETGEVDPNAPTGGEPAPTGPTPA